MLRRQRAGGEEMRKGLIYELRVLFLVSVIIMSGIICMGMIERREEAREIETVEIEQMRGDEN